MSLVAVISGITGQDGSYLAELLSEKGYLIYGLVRHSSVNRLERLSLKLQAYPHLVLKDIDLTDSVSIYNLMKDIKARHFPSDGSETVDVVPAKVLEIYNLAAQSHVKVSFDTPEYTANVDGLGPLRFLEAIRQNDLVKVVRFYQAGTSELYGKTQDQPQRICNESTPFNPCNPYGVAKLYSFWITKNYRDTYGMHASNGILFNHESERRGEIFVTRKITLNVARLSRNPGGPPLELGNIDARRDWGHAQDYVQGMWLIQQQPMPGDYVLSTGETHSVREFVETAFKVAGVTIEWRGEKEKETGHDAVSGRLLVRINPAYYRPAEVDTLIGDSSKAQKLLGWRPCIAFDELVGRMVAADLAATSSRDLPAP